MLCKTGRLKRNLQILSKNLSVLTIMDKIPDIFRHIAIAHVIKHGKIERYKTTNFQVVCSSWPQESPTGSDE